MSTAAPARFTFDLDLRHAEQRARVIDEAALAAMLHDARRQGRDEGFAEGTRSAEARAAGDLAAAAERLAAAVAAAAADLDASRAGIAAEAAGLAAAIGRKLAGHLIVRHPEAEIAALVRECLGSLERAPHLVVRCHPDLADRVREAAEAHVAQSGFAGRLVILGEPDIRLGDGRVEWADGGLVRDVAAISADIDRRIAGWLAANATKEAPAP